MRNTSGISYADHTIPYGTFFRGTLFQALRARLRSGLSLRDALADISQQHPARACCEMSRRDGAIVAWHEVPGTAPSKKSRPVGYGLIRAGVRTDSMIGVTKFRVRKPAKFMLYDFWPTRQFLSISYARSYRTLRDGSFEGRFSRHFVPGYDRGCPYGTRWQTFRNSI